MAWTWEHDGKVYYTASALGYCSKGLLYDRLGVTPEPPPEWLQQAFDQGSENEQRIVEMAHDSLIWRSVDKEQLAADGYEFGVYMEDRDKDYSDQVRVLANVTPGIVVQSHLDGVVEMWAKPVGFTNSSDLGDRRVLEVKAFGDSLWEKFYRHGIKAFPHYEYQVAAQMKGAGLPGLFVVGHKGSDGKVFEIKEQYLDELPVKWMDVIRKILAIEAVVEGRVENLACEKPLQYPCPYYKLHEPDEIPMVEDETERKLLISLAEEYERHRIAEKHHKDMKQRAGKAVAEFFDRRGEKGGKVRVGHWQVTDTVFMKEGAISADKLLETFPGFDVGKYRNSEYEVRYPTVTKNDQ